MEITKERLFPTIIYCINDVLEEEYINSIREHLINSYNKNPINNWQSEPGLHKHKELKLG